MNQTAGVKVSLTDQIRYFYSNNATCVTGYTSGCSHDALMVMQWFVGVCWTMHAFHSICGNQYWTFVSYTDIHNWADGIGRVTESSQRVHRGDCGKLLLESKCIYLFSTLSYSMFTFMNGCKSNALNSFSARGTNHTVDSLLRKAPARCLVCLWSTAWS